MTDEKTEMSPMDRPIRICMMFNTSEKDTFDSNITKMLMFNTSEKDTDDTKKDLLSKTTH